MKMPGRLAGGRHGGATVVAQFVNGLSTSAARLGARATFQNSFLNHPPSSIIAVPLKAWTL